MLLNVNLGTLHQFGGTQSEKGFDAVGIYSCVCVSN